MEGILRLSFISTSSVIGREEESVSLFPLMEAVTFPLEVMR